MIVLLSTVQLDHACNSQPRREDAFC